MTTFKVGEFPQYDKNTTLPHQVPQGTGVTVTVKKIIRKQLTKGIVCSFQWLTLGHWNKKDLILYKYIELKCNCIKNLQAGQKSHRQECDKLTCWIYHLRKQVEMEGHENRKHGNPLGHKTTISPKAWRKKILGSWGLSDYNGQLPPVMDYQGSLLWDQAHSKQQRLLSADLKTPRQQLPRGGRQAPPLPLTVKRVISPRLTITGAKQEAFGLH